MSTDGSVSRWMSGYWLLVPLILAAILIRNWVEEPQTLVPDAPLGITVGRADYLLENFTTRHYDINGALEYHLIGEMLAHYPDDDRAEITKPVLTLTRDQTTWLIVAQGGRLTREPDIVTLIGDVRIERSVDDGSAEPVTILSRNVAIELDKDYLYTDEHVRVETPGLVVEADGLQSSIKEGKLELLSDVKALYEAANPPSFKPSSKP